MLNACKPLKDCISLNNYGLMRILRLRSKRRKPVDVFSFGSNEQQREFHAKVRKLWELWEQSKKRRKL